MDSKYATLEIRRVKDSYKILDEAYMNLEDFPIFEDYTIGKHSLFCCRDVNFLHAINFLNKTKSKIYSTNGMVTMKMLKIFADGNEHHYDDILLALFPGKSKGYDIDCFNGLKYNCFIEFSSKHTYGKMYYKITKLGKEMLKICEVNQPYYRIFRWIRFKGNDLFQAMMKEDLNGGNTSMDLTPESMLELLKNIFDKNSKMRKIGSAYRWLNNVINAYKQNDEAYSLINSELVEKWMNENSLTNPEINRFKTRIEKIKKNRLKNV